jgi:hypothetical protein
VRKRPTVAADGTGAGTGAGAASTSAAVRESAPAA